MTKIIIPAAVAALLASTSAHAFPTILTPVESGKPQSIIAVSDDGPLWLKRFVRGEWDYDDDDDDDEDDDDRYDEDDDDGDEDDYDDDEDDDDDDEDDDEDDDDDEDYDD